MVARGGDDAERAAADGKPNDTGRPSPEPVPTFSGRNAADGACS